MKFNPVYKLSVEVADGNVSLELPFSCEFEIRRQYMASAQTATFRIYNLGEPTRNRLYKDQYDVTQFRAIQFRAGYASEGFTPLLFNGTVLKASSFRAGASVNFITEIEAYDGAFAMVNGDTSQAFAAGVDVADVIRNLNKDLPGVSASPIIGTVEGKTKRGSVYTGNTWNNIVQLSNGLAIIDNGQLKVLGENEAIEAEIPVITSASGLLGSPRRTNAMIEFDMVFEPRFTVGQIVRLESETNTIFNGTYKVMGFVHSGMISPAVGGERKTTVSLWKGTAALVTVPGSAI